MHFNINQFPFSSCLPCGPHYKPDGFLKVSPSFCLLLILQVYYFLIYRVTINYGVTNKKRMMMMFTCQGGKGGIA